MPSTQQVNIVSDTRQKSYYFDRCFWSAIDRAPTKMATQETLFTELGIELEANSLLGYNNCLFAYGQTGSGKTYSVVGGDSDDQKGLLPRLVARFFDTAEAKSKEPD